MMTLLLYILYACLVIHCLQAAARQWIAAGEFGISSAARFIWVASILMALVATIGLMIPKFAMVLPMPFALALFIPSIATGRYLTRKLEVLGTSKTENLEKVTSNTTWVGIFGAALNFLFWVIGIAGYLMSYRR
jgi:hypothetical protein